jgi:hypothetical protein
VIADASEEGYSVEFLDMSANTGSGCRSRTSVADAARRKPSTARSQPSSWFQLAQIGDARLVAAGKRPEINVFSSAVP